MSNNANSILANKIAYFREKYNMTSNLNKAIKQIEQVYVMSGEKKSDKVWSLILVKSNQ